MAEDKGRKDDDNADDQDDDVDDPDDGDDDEETVESLAAKLKAANDDAKKWRFRATGKDAKWNDRAKDTGTKPPGDDKPKGDGQDRAAIEQELRTKLEQEYADKASESDLRASVSVALMTAGLQLSDEQMASPTKARAAVRRVVNMLNLRNLTLEDDGEVAGLDDEIAELKSTYPGLFKAGGGSSGDGGRKTKTRGDGAPRGGGDKANEDPVKDLARAIFGGN